MIIRELDETIRPLAIQRCLEWYKKNDQKPPTLEFMDEMNLTSVFSWRDTPEGINFWNDVDLRRIVRSPYTEKGKKKLDRKLKLKI